MKVSELSQQELRHLLQSGRFHIRTGAFTTRIQTAFGNVAAGIQLLYGEYPLEDAHGFADFHVSLTPPKNLRRWLKPQVEFLFDGKPTFKPLPIDQAFPMLEWGLNWCVSGHAHSYLIIHAAVIEKNGHAAILPAPPGSGKSTLCAALVHSGWRLLSDELTLVRIKDGKLVPLPRPISLKNASIDIIQKFAPGALFSPKVIDTIKGTVAHMKAPSASVVNALEAAKPEWIIFPKYEKDAAATLSDIPRSRAFIRVADNAFNYSTLGPSGFDVLANLVDASSCHEFKYSVLDEAIGIFNQLQPSSPLP